MTTAETVAAASAELDRQLSLPADLHYAYAGSTMAERLNGGRACYYLTGSRGPRVLVACSPFVSVADATGWAEKNGYTMSPHDFRDGEHVGYGGEC